MQVVNIGVGFADVYRLDFIPLCLVRTSFLHQISEFQASMKAFMASKSLHFICNLGQVSFAMFRHAFASTFLKIV